MGGRSLNITSGALYYTVSVKYMINCSETSPVTFLTPQCQRWLRGKSDNLNICFSVPSPDPVKEGNKRFQGQDLHLTETRWECTPLRGQVWV